MKIYNNSLSISPSDRVAFLYPLDYVTPKQRCLESLCAGAAIVLFRHGSKDYIRQIQAARVSVLYATVVHAEQLLQSLPDCSQAVLGQLRVFMIGSSVVTKDLRFRIQKKLTPRLFVYYGMNEFGLCTITTPFLEQTRCLESLGLAPTGVTVEVVDASGQQLPMGETGFVRGKSPGMFDGYLNDLESTERACRDGWFYPGDLGKIGSSGELIFCGRADFMMNMNGVNIYPVEIEHVISSYQAVSDVVAFPLKHSAYQDIQICAVAFYEGREVAEEVLLQFAFQRLGPRAPKRVFVLQKIPRNEQGKLLRGQLMRVVAERLGVSV